MTQAELRLLRLEYTRELEQLRNILFETMASGRLTEADIPDDYRAFNFQINKIESIRKQFEVQS